MKAKIRKIIIDNFLKGSRGLKDEELLFESGLLDSISFIKLLAILEKTFAVTLNMSELTMENFQTVEAIEKIILAKQKKSGKKKAK